jgi:parvulin-like peptidyl-prolyl isomerase
MRRARQDVLIEALFRRVVRERVTDSRIRDYYRQRIVDSADPVLDLQQIRVGTREAARSLRARLDQGAEFEALARINAGSGPGGSDGNRGWVPLVTLAEPVRQALSDAKAGQIVGPVATDQGWLLLRVRDRHGGTAPPLAEVRTAIRRALERQAIRGLIQRLRAETEIHYPQGS